MIKTEEVLGEATETVEGGGRGAKTARGVETRRCLGRGQR